MPKPMKMEEVRDIALATIIGFNCMGDLDKRYMTAPQRLRIRCHVAAAGILLSGVILVEERQFRDAGSPYLRLGADVYAAARNLQRRYKIARYCGWSADEDTFYSRGACLAEAYVSLVRARPH